MLLHALIPASRANGPGLRAVVFFQGCKSAVLAAGTRELIRFMAPKSRLMP